MHRGRADVADWTRAIAFVTLAGSAVVFVQDPLQVLPSVGLGALLPVRQWRVVDWVLDPGWRWRREFENLAASCGAFDAASALAVSLVVRATISPTAHEPLAE